MKKSLLIISLLAVASAAMAQTAPVPGPSIKPGQVVGVKPGAAGVPGRPDPAEMAKRQLERFDLNKDGKVTLKEFLAPANESFKKIDLNNDGAVTAEELAESHKRQMQEFEKMRAAHGGPGRPMPGARPGSMPVAPGTPSAPVAPAK